MLGGKCLCIICLVKKQSTNAYFQKNKGKHKGIVFSEYIQMYVAIDAGKRLRYETTKHQLTKERPKRTT